MQGVSGELDLKKLINPLMVAKAGPMTAASMARFLKALYREAGVSNASSHSGRRTLNHATRRARDRPEGDRRDRRAQQHPKRWSGWNLIGARAHKVLSRGPILLGPGHRTVVE